MGVHDGNSVFGACVELVVIGDKRVGDGGGRYGHLSQSGLVIGNSSGVGRAMSFVVKTLHKVKEAHPGRLQNKGAVFAVERC